MSTASKDLIKWQSFDQVYILAIYIIKNSFCLGKVPFLATFEQVVLKNYRVLFNFISIFLLTKSITEKRLTLQPNKKSNDNGITRLIRS